MDAKPEVTGLKPLKKPVHKRTIIWAVALGITVIAIVGLYSGFMRYQNDLRPVDATNKTKLRFSIKKGQTTAQIAAALQRADLIRSAPALTIHIKLRRAKSSLQPGTYALSQSLSSQQIVEHLESGKTDLFEVTILPGKRLDQIKIDLKRKGYLEQEVTSAFDNVYHNKLLADKPPQADLEGYLFPETYQVSTDQSLSSLFERDFDTLYSRLQKDGYLKAFKKRGLNLHQAMTLSSIIQQEASTSKDQKQISQVFYKRLAMGMKLESDTTFIFAAKKLGVEPSVNLQSPYNTRLHKGLPPGPISNMNYTALQAVAQPATGDFLYFVAGDDGVVHYSKTFKKHQANIKQFCHQACEE